MISLFIRKSNLLPACVEEILLLDYLNLEIHNWEEDEDVEPKRNVLVKVTLVEDEELVRKEKNIVEKDNYNLLNNVYLSILVLLDLISYYE